MAEKGLLDTTEDEGGTTSAVESGAATPITLQEGESRSKVLRPEPIRRSSLEKHIHHRRLDTFPPPVVVHSPVMTPNDSPTLSDTSLAPSPSLPMSPVPAPAILQRLSSSPMSPLSASSTSPTSYPLAASPLNPLSSDDASSPEPFRPLRTGPLVLEQQDGGEETGPHRLEEDASESATDLDAELSSSGNLNGSMASSGVSLFGASRRTPSLMGPSSLLVGSALASAPLKEEAETLTQSPSPTSPPPGAFVPIVPMKFRPRERRRVNISGMMLRPITEPPNEGDHHNPTSQVVGAAAAAGGPPSGVGIASGAARAEGSNPPSPPASQQLPRPRSNTDPEGREQHVSTSPSSAAAGLERAASSPTLRRKSSAPSFLPAPSAHTAGLTSESQSRATSSSPTETRPRLSSSQSSKKQLTFSKLARRSTPLPAAKSALTSMIVAQESGTSASNPFAPLYACLVQRSSDSLSLSIFFPHSKSPTKPLKISVRKDICVEEVVGVGLWAFVEEGWEPGVVEEGHEVGEDESAKWNLRIVEDDGEVDDDFPALDRTRGIEKFGFGMFAIVKATPQQCNDNLAKQASIQRRPSRILSAPKRSNSGAPPTPTTSTAPPPPPPLPLGVAALQLPPAAAGGLGGPAAVSSFRPGTTVGVSSALSIPVLLRVRLPTTAPGVEANTTINVPNDMYMSDVLDHICKKRGLEAKDWSLVVQHESHDVVVPLDRTVESLGGYHSLQLVKRVSHQTASGRPGLVNTNPSASIFKRLSEPPQPKYQSATDLTSAYVRFNVQRKLPMPLGRHPRTITIDGEYIHFLPTDTGGRTSSFHISHIHDCKISRRAPSSFKFAVQTERGIDKRYDFEADSPKVANEIVALVRGMMVAWQDSGRA